MKKYDWILFDCMETIIDVIELPTTRDYAAWAFYGSGIESYWHSFDNFFAEFKLARQHFLDILPNNKEYELSERFEFIIRSKLAIADDNEIQNMKNKLYKNYWKTYKKKCYVKEETKNTLTELSKEYCLGIVSNFMVQGGVEELLEINDVIKYFDFVITSINEGWRKPHPNLYNAAITKTKTAKDKILFIGDDYKNDYIGPQEVGLATIFLDRDQKHPEIKERINNYYELKKYL